MFPVAKSFFLFDFWTGLVQDKFNSPSALFLCTDFNVFHMIAVGLSSSILGCLVTLLVYTYCQRYQQQSHDATVIHPISAAPLNTSITNHINKLDKYDTVEAIKVSIVLCCSEITFHSTSWSKWLSLVPRIFLVQLNILWPGNIQVTHNSHTSFFPPNWCYGLFQNQNYLLPSLPQIFR